MITSFDEVRKRIRDYPAKKIAVANGTDTATLQAVCAARDENIGESLLTGDERAIRETAAAAGLDLKGIEILHEPDPVKAAVAAVKQVSSGKAHVYMKGYIHSDDFLRTVLDRENGLRTENLLNHVFIVEATAAHIDRLVFITDGAMNIRPSLEEKARIISNTVALAQIFGVEVPKVAVLSAVETVSPKIESSMDAAILAKMTDRHQFRGAIVDGPFAMDNAINPEAAAYKKIGGDVAGRADILVVPEIVTGNALVKALVHMMGAVSAGLIFGASAPVVLPSRSDPMECKLMGIACAVYVAGANAEKRVKIGKVYF